MKVLSPIQRIQKDRDNKALKQQFNSLKEKEESLAPQLEPLKEAASVLSQILSYKKEELTVAINDIEAKLEDPLSEQVTMEVQERGNQVIVVVKECKE